MQPIVTLPVQPRIVVFHPRADAYADAIRQAAPDADLRAVTDPLRLGAELADAEVLVTVSCPPEAASQAQRLRWIQMTSAGIEPLLPWRERLGRCAVTNARGMHADQMADYAMAAMFMLHWDVPRILRDQAGAVWRREAKAPLAGRTLGVIGLGAIGQEIARRAQCAGMEVLGVSRSGTAVASVAEVYRQEQLQNVLPRCDFVVLVVPATPETSGLIDAEALRLMKPTASLINFARGSVVEEQALIDALRDRAIKGAVLDVFAAEPLPTESPLWSLPNVIVTPHIAGMSDDYEARFATAFAANLARYRRGEQLLNIVDLARGY